MTLSVQIEQALKDAKVAHTLAVKAGTERDEDWPRFYAHFTACRLAPVLTMLVNDRIAPEDVLPVAHVEGVWNNGPSWVAEVSHETRYSRTHVG